MPEKTFNYQKKSAELEEIIASLEAGTLDIDEALKAYEKAQKILSELEAYLKTAENKITKIQRTD